MVWPNWPAWLIKSDCCSVLASLALIAPRISSRILMDSSFLHRSFCSSLSFILHRIWVLISSYSWLKLHVLQTWSHMHVLNPQTSSLERMQDCWYIESSSSCSGWWNCWCSTMMLIFVRQSLSISWIMTSGLVFLRIFDTLLEARSFLLSGVS